MKKLVIVLSLLCMVFIAAVSASYKWKATREPAITLLDSIKVFDYASIRSYTPSPAGMAEGYKLFLQADDTFRSANKPCESLRLFTMAMRFYPFKNAYQEYSDAFSACHGSDYGGETAKSLAQTNLGDFRPDLYISAARYALERGDTAVVIGLLKICLIRDTGALKYVDAEEMFRPLENYPAYYHMMDVFMYRNPALGRKSSLRTMRFTHPSDMPYHLSTDRVWTKPLVPGDTMPPPYAPDLAHDALADLIRGNRFGRYSRFVDADYTYVATLNLSPHFYTYIYETADGNSIRVAPDEVLGETEAARKLRLQEEDVQWQLNTVLEFYIATIDEYGKVIATQKIGGKYSPTHIATAIVDKDGLIQITDMSQKWAKDPLVSGYLNNEIASRTITGVSSYRVKDNGTIIPITNEVTAKAQ